MSVIKPNTGLMQQNNYTAEQIRTKLNESLKNTDEHSISSGRIILSGSMRVLSEDEIIRMREAERNKPVSLKVDPDEIIRNQFSLTCDNVTYEVDGVTFSNAEMTNLKALFNVCSVNF